MLATLLFQLGCKIHINFSSSNHQFSIYFLFILIWKLFITFIHYIFIFVNRVYLYIPTQHQMISVESILLYRPNEIASITLLFKICWKHIKTSIEVIVQKITREKLASNIFNGGKKWIPTLLWVQEF